MTDTTNPDCPKEVTVQILSDKVLNCDLKSEPTIYELIDKAVIPVNFEIADTGIPIPFKQDNTGYICSPGISKKWYTILGDKLNLNEKTTPIEASGDKFISLRLDGKNFSSVIPKLKKLAIFSQGFSTEFAQIMINSMNYLSDYFQGVLYGFTQSDEITIIINKCNLINGCYEPHEYSGRKDKLISLSASLVTQHFNREIMKLIYTKFPDSARELIEQLPNICFDSRMAVYNTIKDAFELIIWRAYDCSVNGISSGVLLSGISGSKKINKKHCDEKLLYLYEKNLLPLHPHQAYGTLIRKIKKPVEVTNVMTGQTELRNRWVTEKIEGPVIINLKNKIITI